MNTFARDEVGDAFLAQLPPRVVDFVELPLWKIDRIRTLATHVQHELADNDDQESAVLLADRGLRTFFTVIKATSTSALGSRTDHRLKRGPLSRVSGAEQCVQAIGLCSPA